MLPDIVPTSVRISAGVRYWWVQCSRCHFPDYNCKEKKIVNTLTQVHFHILIGKNIVQTEMASELHKWLNIPVISTFSKKLHSEIWLKCYSHNVGIFRLTASTSNCQNNQTLLLPQAHIDLLLVLLFLLLFYFWIIVVVWKRLCK